MDIKDDDTKRQSIIFIIFVTWIIVYLFWAYLDGKKEKEHVKNCEIIRGKIQDYEWTITNALMSEEWDVVYKLCMSIYNRNYD